jgi:hypothetical protein
MKAVWIPLGSFALAPRIAARRSAGDTPVKASVDRGPAQGQNAAGGDGSRTETCASPCP